MTDGLDDAEASPGPLNSSNPVNVAEQQRSTVRSAGRSALSLTVAVGLAVFLAAWIWPQPARAANAQAASGEELFAQHCASCHQAMGQGTEGTFPPLAGNPAAADEAYVAEVIVEGLSGPIEVLGVDYDAVMPPAAVLTDPAEIELVTQYVATLAGSSSGGQDDEPDESESGGPDESEEADEATGGPIVSDIDRGRDLFVGAARFENDGPACAACHTAGSVGNLGGRSLGPDLTDTFQTLGGEAGLTGWLANPPSPTMQPLFVDRPMSEAELADVIAFLGDAPNQNKPETSYDRLTVAGVGGLVALIAGMALAWRGMRQTYVERLQSRAGPNPRRRPSTAASVRVRRNSADAPQPERSQQTTKAGGRSR